MTHRQIAILKWTVDMAEDWRGSMVGNPDPEPLEIFDAQIAEAKAALRQLRKEKKVKG